MEEKVERKKQLFTDEEKKPYGRSIKPLIETCGRNLQRPMYPLIIQPCYFCQKASLERVIFETNGGRWYINIQMCLRCAEYNRKSQEAGNRVSEKYTASEIEEQKAKTSY